MPIVGLVLQHFRCHKMFTLQLDANVVGVVGNNAAGKTSIIEAFSLLSTGESFRAEKDEDMIAFGQELARVKTKILLPDDHSDELEIVITRGMLQGKAVQRKHYFVNGTRRRKKDFLGHFTTVVFRPEDMRLIEGSPTRRRQFVDTILSVVHPEYGTSLTTYEGALKRRNRLIDQIREGQMQKSVLNYWTQLLLKHGSLLQEHRRQFFQEFATAEFPLQFEVEYVPSIVSEERFTQYADKEILAGHTLIGPHKDDFKVNFIVPGNSGWVDVAQFGSRGQQRLAVLWLKLNELQYIERTTGHRPFLLLDDILSELDREHRKQVEDLLHVGQSLVTTTEPAIIEDLQTKIPNLQELAL